VASDMSMELLRPLWHTGYQCSKAGRVSMRPRVQLVVGVVDAGCCSNVATPARPYLAARRGDCRYRVLWGLTSSHLSSVFTTPSCPNSVAQWSGVWPNLSGLSELAP